MRTRGWLSVRLRQLAADGSENVAGCQRSCLPALGALLVVRRARGDRAVEGPGRWVRETARRLGRSPSTISRELRATPLLAAGSSTIACRSRNGSQSWWRAVRRPRSSPPTSVFGNTCKSGSRARFAGLMGQRCRDPRRRLGKDGASRTARTAGGTRLRGSRSPQAPVSGQQRLL